MNKEIKYLTLEEQVKNIKPSIDLHEIKKLLQSWVDVNELPVDLVNTNGNLYFIKS